MTNETIQPLIKDMVIFDLVKEIRDSRNPDELWTKTITIARENQNTQSKDDQLPDIEEMISFGEKILATPKKDRYTLTLERSSSGKLWYDILMGDDNQIGFDLTKDFLEEEFKRTNTKFNFAADIGSGTGNTLRSIAPFCRKIRGLDSSETAMKTANEIGIPENAKILFGNASQLPFVDESLDLVVSNGLVYYLSKNQTENFINEIYRVLKHGGRFFQSLHFPIGNEMFPRVGNIPNKDSKSALLYLMDKMVTGNGNPENINVAEFDILLTDKFLKKVKEYPNNGLLVEYTKS